MRDHTRDIVRATTHLGALFMRFTGCNSDYRQTTAQL
jgi:hypothetical protein